MANMDPANTMINKPFYKEPQREVPDLGDARIP